MQEANFPLISEQALSRAGQLALWRGFWSPGGLELTHSVAASMALPVGSRVLDAGSGSGESSVFLVDAFGWQVTATDLDDFGLVLARDKAKHPGLSLETVQADLRHLPFPDGQFDGVFSQGTVFMFGDKRLDVLRELVRVLRPGGILGLGDPVLTRPGTSKHSPTMMTLEDVAVVLASAGLSVEIAVHHPHARRLWAEFHAPHHDAQGQVRRPGMDGPIRAWQAERDLLSLGVLVARR